MAEKHLVLGLVAHVDAGKTTLSEALLYAGGQLRKLGRVDHGDAFLDTDPQERERGITIFSKQAEVTWPGLRLTLLDTPGHVDFSAEMERTLSVLERGRPRHQRRRRRSGAHGNALASSPGVSGTRLSFCQ